MRRCLLFSFLQSEILAVSNSCQSHGLFGGLSAHERDTTPKSFNSLNCIILFDSNSKANLESMFQVSLEGKIALHHEWMQGNESNDINLRRQQLRLARWVSIQMSTWNRKFWSYFSRNSFDPSKGRASKAPLFF